MSRRLIEPDGLLVVNAVGIVAAMDSGPTLEDVAAMSGERVGRLLRWQEIGLLPGDEELSPTSVERTRLLRYAVDHGIDAEEIARICVEQGDLIGDFAEQIHRPGRSRSFDFDETAAAVGVSPELLERIWTAAGLRNQTRAYDEDIEALRSVGAAINLGLPEAVLLQLIRVFATSQAKIAEATSRLFHFYVHEAFRGDGLRGAELMDATHTVADPLSGLIEPTILYFHRKAWERELMQDMLLHLREEANPPSVVPGEVVRTIAFVDLSSFTPLSEAMGDAVAAEVLERFAEMVRDAAVACEGEVVKQIGDAFMLVFRDPKTALACGLQIEEQVSATPKFPAVRIGAHVGSVLYREGDYVGMTVNIAARVAATAQRHQLLVTRALHDVAQLPDVDFEPLGRRQLKGIAEEVELFRAHRAGDRPIRVLDPVCGMEVDDETTEARLQWHTEELSFCSTGCLRRFLDDPDRYVESLA
jgi:adenylate cyclase